MYVGDWTDIFYPNCGEINLSIPPNCVFYHRSRRLFCETTVAGGNRISVFLAADNNTDNTEPFILAPAPTKWGPSKLKFFLGLMMNKLLLIAFWS